MIKELITHLMDIAAQHKAVNKVGYKRQININDQSNEKYFQFIIDNESLLEKQLVEGIMTLRLNIDVLGFISSDLTVLDVQDTALHIILDFMEYINNDSEYYNLEVRDYSIVSFSEYTDVNEIIEAVEEGMDSRAKILLMHQRKFQFDVNYDILSLFFALEALYFLEVYLFCLRNLQFFL